MKPTVAIFLDLERKSRESIYQLFVFTNTSNKQCKIFDGTTGYKETV